MRCPSTMLVNVMPVVFVLSFVLVQCSPREEERMVLDLAKQLWEIWRELAEEKARGTVFNTVKLLLKDLIMDIGVRPRLDIVDAIIAALLTSSSDPPLSFILSHMSTLTSIFVPSWRSFRPNPNSTLYCLSLRQTLLTAP